MSEFYDWSQDTIAIRAAEAALVEALNARDYAKAIELATTIVVCARHIAMHARSQTVGG